jgi:hypothetical protein
VGSPLCFVTFKRGNHADELQTNDWYVSIAEAVLKIVCTVVAWYLKRRGSRLRRVIVDQVGDVGLDDFF